VSKELKVGDSERTAKIAAQQVEAYWHKLGCLNVRAWTEPIFVKTNGGKQNTQEWVVRSNVNQDARNIRIPPPASSAVIRSGR